MTNKAKYIIFPDATYLVNVSGVYRDVLGKELLEAYLIQQIFGNPEHSDKG